MFLPPTCPTKTFVSKQLVQFLLLTRCTSSSIWLINNRQHLKLAFLYKSLHTYSKTNHHPRANKLQNKTYHKNSLATQEHRPTCQHTGCPKSHLTHRPITKLITGHSIALQKNKSISTHHNTDTSFPNQETLTNELSNPTHWVKSPQ